MHLYDGCAGAQATQKRVGVHSGLAWVFSPGPVLSGKVANQIERQYPRNQVAGASFYRVMIQCSEAKA